MMKKNLFILSFSILFISCVRLEIDRYGLIDLNDKTMTVPVGSKGIKGAVKRVLAEDGWKLAVYKGASVTVGAASGDNVNMATYDKFLTKYKLRASSRILDVCFPRFDNYVSYDISVIDNTTGAEVFSMTGMDCEYDAAKKFIKQINCTDCLVEDM